MTSSLASPLTLSHSTTATAPNRIADLCEPLGVELDFSRTHYAAETARPHILFAPMHYETEYAYPLIVWLHGAGHDERQVMQVMPMISVRNYVAVAPQGQRMDDQPSVATSSTNAATATTTKTLRPRRAHERVAPPRYDWPTTREGVAWAERAVFESIDLAARRCHIARHRIFLVGSGNGGTMALQLATRFPQEFAAVVSIGGGVPTGELPLRCWSQVRRLSTLLITGESSQHFAPTEANALWRLLHSAGVPVTLQQHTAGDELTTAMLADVNRYLMATFC